MWSHQRPSWLRPAPEGPAPPGMCHGALGVRETKQVGSPTSESEPLPLPLGPLRRHEEDPGQLTDSDEGQTWNEKLGERVFFAFDFKANSISERGAKGGFALR